MERMLLRRKTEVEMSAGLKHRTGIWCVSVCVRGDQRRIQKIMVSEVVAVWFAYKWGEHPCFVQVLPEAYYFHFPSNGLELRFTLPSIAT